MQAIISAIILLSIFVLCGTLGVARSPFMQSRTDGGIGPLVLSDPRFYGAGNVFFVQSTNANAGDSAGKGQTPDAPFSTIDYAVGQCTASKGDLIIVLPGHVETISAAASLNVDVAGVKIIGVGWGELRPRLNYTAVAGTVAIDADDIWLENLQFYGNVTNGVTIGVDVKTGADDLVIKNCDFRAASATKELLIAISIAAVNARQSIIDCTFWEAAGDATAAIATVGACDDLLIQGCFFDGTYSAAVIDIDAGSAVVVRPKIINNLCYNSDTAAGLFCTLDSTVVGFFVGNRSGIGKANTVPVSDASASIFIDNLATDAAAISELKYPATATAWS